MASHSSNLHARRLLFALGHHFLHVSRARPSPNRLTAQSFTKAQALRRGPLASTLHTSSLRCNTTSNSTPGEENRKTIPYKPAPHRNPEEPVYTLAFTCKACNHRSAHTISKQGYHKGTVLVACPGCKNRHLIADHLHIFSDKAITLQDILQSKGEELQRGVVGPQGEMEFWEESAVDAEGQNSSLPAGQSSSN